MTEPDRGSADVFADLARRLHAEATPEKTRNEITRAALATVKGCDHASISLIGRHGDVRTVASTDDVPILVDTIQYDTWQGPCVDALSKHETYLIDDLRVDGRWPAFGRRAAAETGVRSMLAVRLFVQGDTIGALNLYSRRPSAFDEDALDVGRVLASHAAIALTAAREHEHVAQLEDALRSNREIGMAAGVLMVRHGVTEDEAFALLRRTSQYLNVKLREIAAQVVETGRLPARPDVPS